VLIVACGALARAAHDLEPVNGPAFVGRAMKARQIVRRGCCYAGNRAVRGAVWAKDARVRGGFCSGRELYQNHLIVAVACKRACKITFLVHAFIGHVLRGMSAVTAG